MLLHWGGVHTNPMKATLCQSGCNWFSVKAENLRRASRGRPAASPLSRTVVGVPGATLHFHYS